jgi:hypothetical protein
MDRVVNWVCRERRAHRRRLAAPQGPAYFGHINFRGTMRFGIERFAQALIDDHAGSARQLRLV